MHAFELDELLARLTASDRTYLEFLRVPSMSMGIYRLAAGDVDRQSPHTEYEAYFVIRGRATFRTAAKERPSGRARSSSSRKAWSTASRRSPRSWSCWSSSRRRRIRCETLLNHDQPP